MTNFAAGTSTDRLGAGGLAGDLAEKVAEQVLAERGRPLIGYGPKRLSTGNAPSASWPKTIAHTPDYLSLGAFVEVQGTNQDKMFFKHSKLWACWQWEQWAGMPVRFVLFIQHQGRVILTDLATLAWAVRDQRSVWDEQGPGEDTNPKPGWWVPLEVLDEHQVADAWRFGRTWWKEGRPHGTELLNLRGVV